MSKPLSILLVDDHQMFRQGVAKLLSEYEDLTVVAQADRARGTLEMVRELQPDVLILDINLPDGTGLALARELELHQPSCRVLVLSMCADDRSVTEAVEAGVAGYVPKIAPIDDLVRAIRAVGEGAVFLHPLVGGAVTRQLRKGKEPRTEPLTERERSILVHLARGHRTDVIATDLNVSVSTVKSHLSTIYQKLGVRHRTEAVLRAVELGLVAPQTT